MKTTKHKTDFSFGFIRIAVFGFLGIFVCLFCLPFGVQADSSFPVWLEKKRFTAAEALQSSGGNMGKGAEHKAQKKSPHAAMSKTKDEKKDEKKGEKKPRRRPMSRPAFCLLKTGDFLASTAKAPNLAKTVCWLKSPDQSYKKLIPAQRKEGFFIYDDAFLEGLYQLFLFNDAGVKDGVRYRHYSTLWFRNAGEKDFEMQTVSQEPREGMHGEEPVFYLKELTKDKENNFVVQRRYTGDTVPVQVLFHGKPVAGLPVTLLTQQGWKKTVVTDEKGMAEFLLIKEVFHGESVNKRPEEYFFKVEYELAAKGKFEGVAYEKEKYVSSLRLLVFPTPSDWESKSTGFYLIVGSILAVILAAAIRRKRMRTI